MRLTYLQERLATGSLPLLVAFLIASALWWLPSADTAAATTGGLWDGVPGLLTPFGGRLAGYILLLLALLLLGAVTVHHAVIRVHSTFYLTLFLLLAAVAQPHTLQGGSVSACCLAATFYFLFRTYQGVEPVGDVFRGFFFYGLATLAVPPLLLLLPVLLLMQTGFHHLSPRTLCAALIGALLPYWFLGGYAYTIGEWDLLLRQLAAVVRFSPTDYSTLTPPAIATLALTLLLTLWSIIHYARNSFLDKIRTRTCIYYILSTEALLWVLLAFQPVLYPSLAAPLTACASLLVGHYFAVTRDRRSGIGLLVTLALIAALYLLDVWTQLYSSF